MIEWSEAPESVISLAQRLIGQHHQHLMDYSILFACRSEPAAKNGWTVYAGTSLVPAKLKVVYPYDFFIWVAEWGNLSNHQREALIDHELSHCGVDDKERVYLKGHDIEEFAGVLERHGLWSAALAHAQKEITGAVQKLLPGLDRVEISNGKGKVVTLTGAEFDRLAEEVKA